jgi:hypothetical protein
LTSSNDRSFDGKAGMSFHSFTPRPPPAANVFSRATAGEIECHRLIGG